MLVSSLLHPWLRRALPLVILLGLAAATDVRAQSWRQTVEIIVPVDPDGITGALLDTLIAKIDQDNIQVRRERDSQQKYALSQLESAISNEGLFLNSANNVFIIYRMEGDQRGFRSKIEEMFFIYRQEGEYAGEDLPVMLIDGRDSFVTDVLMNSGTNLDTNEAAFKPFNDQMMMHQLAATSRAVIVKVGDRVIRTPRESEQERLRLLTTIRQFLNL